jgi:hypothetical protein
VQPGYMLKTVARVIAQEERGRLHLRSSVCIDVRPAKLVERAAAPSEPMPFELRESERGSRRVKGKNGTGRGGRVAGVYHTITHYDRWNVTMTVSCLTQTNKVIFRPADTRPGRYSARPDHTHTPNHPHHAYSCYRRSNHQANKPIKFQNS